MKLNFKKAAVSAFFIVLAVVIFYKPGVINCKGGHSYDLSRLNKIENLYPVVVLGSGPAGLSSAIYTSRAGYNTLVLEGNLPGGQLTQTSYVENWPGEKKILGSKLIDDLKQQAASFGAKFLNDRADAVNLKKWPFEVMTADGPKIYALSVVVATGANPRTLGIPGEKEYWGRGVTTCAICDAPFYKGRNVIVVGGGDSAAEEAMQLATHAKSIEVLVRKDKMRASKAMQDNVAKLPNVSISYNKEIKKIIGDNNHVTGVDVYDNKSKETSSVPIDGVFLAIGHVPNTQIFKDQLNLNLDGYIDVKNRSQKTSIKGVFAAGDVEDFTYRQGGVASGSGIKAALDAEDFLKEIGITPEILKSIKPFDPTVKRSVKELTVLSNKADLEKFVKGSNVVIDFYGDTCPPCKKMMPIFEELAAEIDNVKFAKFNIASDDLVADELEIVKIPCFVVYKNGQFADKRYGAVDKKRLHDWILEKTK